MEAAAAAARGAARGAAARGATQAEAANVVTISALPHLVSATHSNRLFRLHLLLLRLLLLLLRLYSAAVPVPVPRPLPRPEHYLCIEITSHLFIAANATAAAPPPPPPAPPQLQRSSPAADLRSRCCDCVRVCVKYSASGRLQVGYAHRRSVA